MHSIKQAHQKTFVAVQVSDFRNDVILAEACRNDVDKYCKKIQPGTFNNVPVLCFTELNIQYPREADIRQVPVQTAASILAVKVHRLPSCTTERALYGNPHLKCSLALQGRGACTSACASTATSCRTAAARRNCISTSCRRRCGQKIGFRL